MKKIFLYISVLIVIFASACSTGHYLAQKDVPYAVVYAFQNKYPDGKVTRWELEQEGVWEVYFKEFGKQKEAQFRTNGSFIKEE